MPCGVGRSGGRRSPTLEAASGSAFPARASGGSEPGSASSCHARGRAASRAPTHYPRWWHWSCRTLFNTFLGEAQTRAREDGRARKLGPSAPSPLPRDRRARCAGAGRRSAGQAWGPGSPLCVPGRARLPGAVRVQPPRPASASRRGRRSLSGREGPPQPPPRPHLRSRKRPGRERGGPGRERRGGGGGAGQPATAAAPSRADCTHR